MRDSTSPLVAPGHVAAIWAQAKALGFPQLLGPPCTERDLALALIMARVCAPASKLATSRWWADTTLAADLGVDQASSDDVYSAMDRLVARQDRIEATLANKHLRAGALVYYDLSSSWVEGRCCPLAARGYSRDSKTGKAQIEYGLLTDERGCPVSVEVFAGNTADPTAFMAAVDTIRTKFNLAEVVMVGDRGMITSARIESLKDLGGLSWITSLRAPATKARVEGGALQLSLFDEANLAEIPHPDYPDERLIACRNPALAAERSRKRDELLAATEKLLTPIKDAVDAGRLVGADKIGVCAGRAVNRYKMAKHFGLDLAQAPTRTTVTRPPATVVDHRPTHSRCRIRARLAPPSPTQAARCRSRLVIPVGSPRHAAWRGSARTFRRGGCHPAPRR